MAESVPREGGLRNAIPSISNRGDDAARAKAQAPCVGPRAKRGRARGRLRQRVSIRRPTARIHSRTRRPRPRRLPRNVLQSPLSFASPRLRRPSAGPRSGIPPREVALRPPGVRPRAERGRRAPSIGRVRPAPAARSRPQRVSEGGSPRSAPEPVCRSRTKSPAPTPEFTWWCGFPSALPRIWTRGYPPPRKPESGSMRSRRIISRRRLAPAYSSVTGASTKRRSRKVSSASREIVSET